MYNPNSYGYQQPPQPASSQIQSDFYPSQYVAPGNPANGGPPFFGDLSGSMDNQYLNNPSFGASQGDISGNQLPRGIIAAFSTSGYPGEPSLLEELDINFDHIKAKTLAVLNPITASKMSTYSGPNSNILNDSDLAGPIFFVLLYGFNLLLAGKVHFGYIYGCGLFGSLSLFSLFKLMSNNDAQQENPPVQQAGAADINKTQDLDYSRTTSVLGYCLLPLVLLSLLGIVLSLDNFWGYLLSLLTTIWSTYSASGIFVLVLNLKNSRFLVAYPLLLFYSMFALMAIFVEKA